MTPQELANYIRDNASEGNQWENYISNKLVDDADEELLRQYVEKAKAAGRISFDYTDKATVLKKLGLSEGDRLTNAGKVLFADDIVQDVQMAIFATNERVTFNDIQRVHGPIIRLVDVAEKYIMNNIHWRVEFDGSIQRKEYPEIPADAVREALINSFCHKDHGSGQSNEVAIFKNRIEIYNPGQFPKGYTPEDFIEHSERPVRRNPVIARSLYYSKDVESFGSGLKRIHDACTSAGVRYDFIQLKSGFVVIFYRSTEAGNADIGGGKAPISADIVEKILAYIAQKGSITNSEAQAILGLKETRTKEILGSLVQQMVLDRIGKNKGTRYIKHGTVADEIEVAE